MSKIKPGLFAREATGLVREVGFMLGVIIVMSHVIGLSWQKGAFQFTGPRPVPMDMLPLGLPAIFWAFLICGIIVMITGYAAGYARALGLIIIVFSVMAAIAAYSVDLSIIGGTVASIGKLRYLGILALGTTTVTIKKNKKSLGFFELLDRAIYEPIRFLALEKLWIHGTSSFAHLRDSIREEIPSLTNGNLSSHLNYLESIGYVKAQRFIDGKKARSNYTITENGKRAFELFLISLYKRLHQSIKALKVEQQTHAHKHA